MQMLADNLLAEFGRRLRDARSVDLAVAWATGCTALHLLQLAVQKRGLTLRAIVGVSGNATDPAVLRALSGVAQLRVAEREAGIFHPKLYLFHGPKETFCWIGSANLTSGGFGVNSELVAELQDNGEAQAWFDQLWNSLPTDPMPHTSLVMQRPAGSRDKRRVTTGDLPRR